MNDLFLYCIYYLMIYLYVFNKNLYILLYSALD